MDIKSFDNEWEVIHSTQEWGMYPTEHVIRFVARNYYKTERNQIKILDFGCGTGAHSWYLAREGFDVYAFDGSESAIKRAKVRFEKEHLKAHFEIADALDIYYPDEYFDAVIDNVCVYGNLIQNIKKMYFNIYRMLKPGGKLLFTCFGKRTDGYGSGEALEKDTYVHISEETLKGRGTTHFFSSQELEDILMGVGFKNVDIDTILYTDNHVQVEQFLAIARK